MTRGGNKNSFKCLFTILLEHIVPVADWNHGIHSKKITRTWNPHLVSITLLCGSWELTKNLQELRSRKRQNSPLLRKTSFTTNRDEGSVNVLCAPKEPYLNDVGKMFGFLDSSFLPPCDCKNHATSFHFVCIFGSLQCRRHLSLAPIKLTFWPKVHSPQWAESFVRPKPQRPTFT